jgi:hypothetical protein
MPVVRPIVAMAVLLLLQVPPVTRSPSVTDWPGQTLPGPKIDGGAGFTVTVVITLQPILYTMVSTPVESPAAYTTPVNGFTVAIFALLLVQ